MIRFIELTPDYYGAVPELVNLGDVKKIRKSPDGLVIVDHHSGTYSSYKESYDNMKRNLTGMVIKVVPQ